MPIKVTCSNCGGVLHAPDDAGGKRGRCPTCGNVLPIPADASRVAAPVPSVPAPPKATARSQSFGEFALPPNEPAQAQAPKAESRKASVPLPPPTIDAPKGGRPDPFARAGTTKAKPMLGEASEGSIRNWKRVSRGLWWVRAAALFLILPPLLLSGVKLYEHFVKPLPYKDPGYLGLDWFTSVQELELAAVGIPLFFGLPMLFLGRLGVASAPKRAYSWGLAMYSALATLVVLAGAVAIVVPAIAMVVLDDGKKPPIIFRAQNQVAEWQLLPPQDAPGIVQHAGLMIGFAALIVAEFWFLATMGRLGVALESAKLASRSTRLLVALGLILGISLAVGALRPERKYHPDLTKTSGDAASLVQKQWDANGQAEYDKLGANKVAVRAGLYVGLVLFLGLGYFRMIGAGRGAIRGWLERHEKP